LTRLTLELKMWLVERTPLIRTCRRPEIDRALAAKIPRGQAETRLLARACHTPWTHPARNLAVLTQVTAAVDAMALSGDPKGKEPNPGWVG
jgi:hypothetical protein